MVAKGTGVEDAVCAVVVLDCGVSHVDCGFWSSCCQSFGVFVDIVEVVLEMVSYTSALRLHIATYVELGILSNLLC